MKNKNWFVHSCTIVMALLVCASCAKSGLDEEIPKGLASVTIEFDVPASQEMVTRSVEDEGQVRTLDVLFFDASGANSVDPIYQEKRHLNYVVTVELGKIRAVIKDLPMGTYRVVAVANADATLLDGLAAGDKLSTIERTLLTPHSTTMPASNLLMVGESTKDEVISDGAQVLSTISLVRAVARIDVLCFLKNSLTTPFELTSAEVRNARSQGYLFGQYLLADKDKVAVPAGATIVDYVRAPVTDAHPTYADADGSIVAQLYAYENSVDDHILQRDETTCLIVGGKFNGSNVTTYYRLDLSNSNGKYVIKRNHRYVLTITAVLGPGYASKDEAEQGLQNNLKAEIMEWVEGGSSGIMMEGDKMISVSKTRFDVEMYSLGQVVEMGVIIKNLKTDAFRIEQDGPSGEWLEIDNVDPFVKTADEVYEKSVRFRIRQDNVGVDARVATLKISAGGALFLLVKVVQGNSDRIMLDYVTPELGSKAVSGQKIDFAFVDPNQNQPTTGLHWLAESRTDWITIDTTGGKPDNGIGAGSFYINTTDHPSAGYSRRGIVRLTVSETVAGETKFYYRTIQVVQYNVDGTLEYVSIDGQVQRSLKIPDKGFTSEKIFIVKSRTAITLQKDAFPSAWQAELRYVTDGAYQLSIQGSAVPDRDRADELTLDTYRIGYLKFVNNAGKTLRTMLVYQGYVKALPNTVHVHGSNYSSIPAADKALDPHNGNGLLPQTPDVPIIYELIAQEQKVWLDRNINALVPNNTPSTAQFPEWAVTKEQRRLALVGSKLWSVTHSLYADAGGLDLDQARRSQGPCPAGFRVPRQTDIATLLKIYPYVDDNGSTKKYPWYVSFGEMYHSTTLLGRGTPDMYGKPSYFTVSIGYNTEHTLGVSSVITGTAGGFYRCISDK